MRRVGPTAPAVSGGMKLVVVPLRAASRCARKPCDGAGEAALRRPSGRPSGGAKGEATVMWTFGSALSCGSGIRPGWSGPYAWRCASKRESCAQSTRLDRELGLVEILRLAAQPVVTERGDGVERLQEQVGDLELRELGPELLD